MDDPYRQAAPTTLAPHRKYCHACANVLDARAELCPQCGIRQMVAHSAESSVSVVMQPSAPIVIVTGAEKSVAGAALLAFFFGPLGMIYSTGAGALVMFIINIAIFLPTLGLGYLLTIPISMIWAGCAASSHNQRMRPTVVLPQPLPQQIQARPELRNEVKLLSAPAVESATPEKKAAKAKPAKTDGVADAGGFNSLGTVIAILGAIAVLASVIGLRAGSKKAVPTASASAPQHEAPRELPAEPAAVPKPSVLYCDAKGTTGICLPVSQCTGKSTPGRCGGAAADVQCCTKVKKRARASEPRPAAQAPAEIRNKRAPVDPFATTDKGLIDPFE